MTTGNREDYLISILRLTEGEGATKTTELASFMKVSPASVSEMLKILAAEGLVEYEKYKGVKLTGSGLNYARHIRKKHHIMERFLMDVLNVDGATAHKEACKMEHVLSDESAVKICQMIGSTIDCDCQSCTDPCKAVSFGGVTITAALTDVCPGEHGVISHIKNGDASTVKKLILMGLIPGREIALDADQPDDGARIVQMGGSSIALDAALASSVYVDTRD
ncbi:MAG: metal-dependent transcriptional regulator [Candidatus Methanoplasma sp.]|jgi:DtxR family Mn-dependent transcriptional regulator|nr:metal-dependent transcriptional regulator [Candidatus Methanoplasma sp.]